jgi:hypothetical protein
MKFQLSIAMDNAAFIDNPSELADILRSLADKVKDFDSTTRCVIAVRDSNGNRVGEATFTDD